MLRPKTHPRRFPMEKQHSAIFTVLFLTGVAAPAQAALIDRGGGLIYDTDLDITWLQDANHARTSGYDADGLMTYDEAMTWAANLDHAGYRDWRLPFTREPDPTCSTASSFGTGCQGSEMGHLYHVSLGNQVGGPITNTGPFLNLQTGLFDYYVSSTLDSPDFARSFVFLNGSQDGIQVRSRPNFPAMHAYALAVRSGDSCPVRAARMNLSTGYDELAGGAIPEGGPDDNYQVWVPQGPFFPVASCAIVVPGNAFPFGSLIPNTPASRWIGLAAAGSIGSYGTYAFTVDVDVPPGIDPTKLAIIGRWSSDNATVGILVNGNPTGMKTTTDFTGYSLFDPSRSRGWLQTGVNHVIFVVDNVFPGDSPVGLRVEARLDFPPEPAIYEDLPLGATYHHGDVFVAGGAKVAVEEFFSVDGTATTSGSCQVDALGKSGSRDHELHVENVDLNFDFGAPIFCLEMYYGEFGGNINLEINGQIANVADFVDLPTTLGGVALTVISFDTLDKGRGVFMAFGTINSFKIGGQELWISYIDLPDCSIDEGGSQKPGDSNQDLALDLSDGIHVLNYLFLGTVPRLPCGDGTSSDPGNVRLLDSNGDYQLDLADVVYLFQFLFMAGRPPEQGLDCVRIQGCPDRCR
jgi:hypothetical protein